MHCFAYKNSTTNYFNKKGTKHFESQQSDDRMYWFDFMDLQTYLLLRQDREYLMNYRWPGFVAVIWYGSSPTLSSPTPASCLSLSLFWLLPHPLPAPTPASCLSLSLPVCGRSSLLTGEGGRSQIILKQQSLVLCKSFNTLCFKRS